MTQIPLTNVLGFEFSFVNALVLSFFGGLAIIIERWDGIRFRSVQILIPLSIPFIISFLHNAIFSICPLSTELFYYFLITIPAYLFGSSLGYALNSAKTKISFFLFLSVYFLTLSISLAEFYFLPQVYTYNPLFGYFPGTIYDESVPITLFMVAFSIFTTFLGIMILLIKKIKSSKYRTILVIFLIVLIYPMKIVFGFSTTIFDLKSELGGEFVSDDFTIIYPEEIKSENLILLKNYHRFYIDQLAEQIGSKPDSNIVAIVFRDSEEKRKLFGAGAADVAKPWLNQIYIDQHSFRSTLKHELAHVFMKNYGVTPFKVANWINPSLIEGFAMAFENDFDDQNIHTQAKLAKTNNVQVSIPDLFDGLSFLGNLSSISYIYSGSFISYLMSEYSTHSILTIYGDSNFKKHTGKDLNTLEKEYNNFLDNYENVLVNEQQLSTFYFGRKPMFKKTCPRIVAEGLATASNLYRAGKYELANSKYSELFNYSGAYGAFRGCLVTLIMLQEFNQADSLLNENIEKFAHTSYQYNLQLLKADIKILTDSREEAQDIYNDLYRNWPRPDYLYIAYQRLFLLTQGDSFLKDYLKSDNSERADLILDSLSLSAKLKIIPTVLSLADSSQILGEKQIEYPENLFLEQYVKILIADYYLNSLSYEKSWIILNELKNSVNPYFQKRVEDKIGFLEWVLESETYY